MTTVLPCLQGPVREASETKLIACIYVHGQEAQCETMKAFPNPSFRRPRVESTVSSRPLSLCTPDYHVIKM